MSRPRKLAPREAGAVVWGWYSVFVLPDGKTGAGAPGLVVCRPNARAFWAVWWTDDPRLVPDADPDDFGFVEGGASVDQAVAQAYDALRRGRGPRVFDRSIGASFAMAAFREGAPQRRDTRTDFDALALEGLGALGLPPDATPAAIRKAFKAKHPDQGGDAAVDMHRLTQLYKSALARAKRRVEDAQRASIVAGVAPKRRKKRRPKTAPGPLACA